MVVDGALWRNVDGHGYWREPRRSSLTPGHVGSSRLRTKRREVDPRGVNVVQAWKRSPLTTFIPSLLRTMAEPSGTALAPWQELPAGGGSTDSSTEGAARPPGVQGGTGLGGEDALAAFSSPQPVSDLTPGTAPESPRPCGAQRAAAPTPAATTHSDLSGGESVSPQPGPTPQHVSGDGASGEFRAQGDGQG